MKITNPWFLVCAVVFVLVSCQKEKSIDTLGQSGSSTGNWKFLYLQASTSTTIDEKDPTGETRSITLSDYTTDNNTGTVNFSGTKMSYTGLSYTIDGVAQSLISINGGPYDTTEIPFTASLPATSGEATYKKISSDSLYFTSGSVTSVGTGGTVSSQPAGYKLNFFGDTMTMTQVYDNVQLNLSPGGGSTKTIIHVLAVTALKKM